MRAGGVAGRADEADGLAGVRLAPGDDRGIEHRHVAVRPGLAVVGLDREADAAAGSATLQAPSDDRVRQSA